MSNKLEHRLLTRAARKPMLFKRAPLGVALCSFALAAAAYCATASIDPSLFLDDVKFLASKNLKGRGTGTPELEKAAAFIAAKFRSFGLEPIDGKSYYQAFSVTTNAKLGKDNRFAYTADGRHIKLVFRRQRLHLQERVRPGAVPRDHPAAAGACNGEVNMRTIRILVVEDSVTIRKRLIEVF